MTHTDPPADHRPGRRAGAGPTLVNVCGTSYAGTTMLDLMLGNHADAFSCGEVSAWYRPYRPEHLRLRCPCGNLPCPVWERIGRPAARDFHRRVADVLGVSVVVDSSKDLAWVRDTYVWGPAHGMGVQTVLVWKEPKQLAYSFWKRGGSVDVARTHFLRYHRRLLDLGLPMVAVPYRALVGDPEDMLRALCRRLGLEWRPGQHRFWEGEHHHAFGNAGTRGQLERATGRIRPVPSEFPEAFLRVWDRADWTIARGETARILSELEHRSPGLSLPRHDHHRHGADPIDRPGLPFWYIRRRAARGLIATWIRLRHGRSGGHAPGASP